MKQYMISCSRSAKTTYCMLIQGYAWLPATLLYGSGAANMTWNYLNEHVATKTRRSFWGVGISLSSAPPISIWIKMEYTLLIPSFLSYLSLSTDDILPYLDGNTCMSWVSVHSQTASSLDYMVPHPLLLL